MESYVKASKKAKVSLVYSKIGTGGKTSTTKIYSDVKEMTETLLMQKVYKDYPKEKFTIEIKSIDWM